MILDVLSVLNPKNGKLYVQIIKTRLTALKTPDYGTEPKRAWPSLVPDPWKRTTDEQRESVYFVPGTIPRQLDRLQHHSDIREHGHRYQLVNVGLCILGTS